MKKLHIATAPRPKGRFATNYKDNLLTDSEFFELLAAEPKQAQATYKKVQELYKRKAAGDKAAGDELQEHKKAASYIGGHLEPCVRADENVKNRQVIAIDIDNAPEGVEADKLLALLTKRIKKLGYKAAILLTFGHSDTRPRVRVVMILNRPIEGAAAFKSITQQIGQQLGVADYMDKVSNVQAQLMYYGRMPKRWKLHIKTPYATIINGKRVDVDQFDTEAAEREEAAIIAKSANHATTERGFKGAFNQYAADNFGDLASYVNATAEIPYTVGQGNGKPRVDHYDREDVGFCIMNEDRLQIKWSDAEIVQSTGRVQHDAASLTAFYLFGDDFKAFIKYCRKLGIKPDAAEDFANFVEDDDESEPPARAERKATETTTKPNKALKTSNKTVTLGDKVKAKARELPDCTFENERGKLVLDWVALADEILEAFEVRRIRRSSAITFAIYDDDAETWTQNEHIAKATLESIVTHAIKGQDAGAPTTQTRNNIASYVRTIAPMIPERVLLQSFK